MGQLSDDKLLYISVVTLLYLHFCLSVQFKALICVSKMCSVHMWAHSLMQVIVFIPACVLFVIVCLSMMLSALLRMCYC